MNEGRTLKDMVDGYGFRQFKPSYVYLIDIQVVRKIQNFIKDK